jgi:hypothetical protein
VAAGDVRSVTVSGGLQGFGVMGQEVTWRRWGITRTATVTQVSPGYDLGDRSGTTSQRVGSLDIGVQLQRLSPSLTVVRDSATSNAHSVLGAGVPAWGAGVYPSLLLGTLLLVVCGPSPWRATRWAWFWLMLVPFVGPVAIALLGGPVAVLHRWLPPPRRGRRPLTGGRAAFVVIFLLAFIVV